LVERQSVWNGILVVGPGRATAIAKVSRHLLAMLRAADP
jgi:hypothetical protein